MYVIVAQAQSDATLKVGTLANNGCLSARRSALFSCRGATPVALPQCGPPIESTVPCGGGGLASHTDKARRGVQ